MASPEDLGHLGSVERWGLLQVNTGILNSVQTSFRNEMLMTFLPPPKAVYGVPQQADRSFCLWRSLALQPHI